MRDLIDGGNDAVFLGIERDKRNVDGDTLSAMDYFDGGEAFTRDDRGRDPSEGFDDDFEDFLSSPGYKLFKSETGKGRRQWKKLSNAKQQQYKDRAGRSAVGGFINRNLTSIKDDVNDAIDKLAPGAKEDAEYCNNNYGTKKGFFAGKRVALSPSRSAFLGLIKLNYRGLASRMGAFLDRDPNNWKKLEKKYCTLGGGADSLRKSVNQGKNKKPLLCGARCKAKLPANFSGYSLDGLDFDYNYPTGAEETAAAAATASPILASIGATLTAISAITSPASDIANDIKSVVEKDEEEDDKSLTPDEREAAEKNFENAENAVNNATEQTAGFGEGANKLLLPLGALVAAVVLLKSFGK
jgi:hypothetical protein